MRAGAAGRAPAVAWDVGLWRRAAPCGAVQCGAVGRHRGSGVCTTPPVMSPVRHQRRAAHCGAGTRRDTCLRRAGMLPGRADHVRRRARHRPSIPASPPNATTSRRHASSSSSAPASPPASPPAAPQLAHSPRRRAPSAATPGAPLLQTSTAAAATQSAATRCAPSTSAPAAVARSAGNGLTCPAIRRVAAPHDDCHRGRIWLQRGCQSYVLCG